MPGDFVDAAAETAAADVEAAVLGFSALVVAADSYRRAAADYFGLNVVETHAISYLDAYGPMPQSRLARLMDLTGGAVTGLVDRLERLGTARRTADPTDRRRHRVELTEKTAEILVESRTGLARAFERFEPETLKVLVHALPTLAVGVTAEADALRQRR